MEQPYVPRHDGGQTKGLVLDIVVTPERQWEWKDADEFDRRVGHPSYLDRDAAQAVRSTGERLIKVIDAGDFHSTAPISASAPIPAGRCHGSAMALHDKSGPRSTLDLLIGIARASRAEVMGDQGSVFGRRRHWHRADHATDFTVASLRR